MNKLSFFVGVILLAMVWALILSLPLMWLWNVALVPAVTILKPIGWLQALGISILVNILFKSELEVKS